MAKTLIVDKLAGLGDLWKPVVQLLLKELKKQWADLVLFWSQAEDLGIDTDLSEAEGWKAVVAAIEWVAFHGTPTPETTETFLRKKKLIE